MPKLVLDCSAFMSLFLRDEHAFTLDLAAYTIHVPGHFYLECINVLRIALVRQRISADEFTECLDILYELPFVNDSFITLPESILLINRLSHQHNLTSYDAAYLELAMRMDAPLATNDKTLINACNHCNITIGA